jgi:predicted glycoside hydrolase/deacetylase ChbG (UPF0249 family)
VIRTDTSLHGSRRLAVCADDYSMAPGVSAAIRALLDAGRITATSCMTVFADWPEQAARLRDTGGGADLGLHLVLSDLAPLGPMPRTAPSGRLPPLPRLIGMALGRALDRGEVAGEIARQLDAFETAMGRPPAFVDGHRHVHVLPGVREAVLALYGTRLDPARAWLRVCTSPMGALFRRGGAVPHALLIDRLSRPLGRMAARHGLLANDDFRGVTTFPPHGVAHEFERWITGPGHRPLMMCHPGRVDEALRGRDPVHARREEEFAYLAGPRWPEALAERGVTLAPLSAMAGVA